MKNLLRILPVLAVAAFLAGCEGPCSKIDTINAPDLTSGSANFTNVAAVGTSISAGYQSSGLASRHQVRAFPALFAQQVGMTAIPSGAIGFTFNGISNDGIPTLLEIKSLSPLVINNTGRLSGAPMNNSQGEDYHNLGVPGALAVDFVDSTYYTADPNPVRGANYNKTFFNLVFRGRGLGLQQLIRRQPTFVTFELGANEVLGAATTGTANVFPTNSYIASVTAALDQIHAALPNAKVAVFNVPDVTSIPFCTTFSPVTVSTVTHTPVPLLGPNDAPLSPGDLVLLTAGPSLAAGVGFSTDGYNYVNPAAPGTGTGLSNAQVLDETEQGVIATAVTNMNAALDAIVAARPWATLVDLHGLLADIAANGYTVGSVTYTKNFVTGGLFSLDGVHPNDLGHAIICNALIDAVNARFGATVPHLNVTQYATATSSRMQPATGESVVPASIEGLGDGMKMLWPKR